VRFRYDEAAGKIEVLEIFADGLRVK
jgi:hypothetical protein